MVERQNFYAYDKAGYYNYLPAVFIYHDIDSYLYRLTMEKKYEIVGESMFGLYELPNGKRINKYPIGVSIFELPAFLIAHAYCLISGQYPADGYSSPYEAAMLLSTILWSFLALLVLRRFLLRHFSDTVVMIVLLAIGFGTNFYTYSVFDHGMSHNYSFFLFSALLLFMDRWLATGERKDICIIGVLLGLIVITRPVNVLVVLLPLLWGVYNRETLTARTTLLASKYKDILIAFICFFAVAFIQLSYWKYSSGQWVYFSYIGEEFNFKNPQIINGLFSFRKGWFVYTPIAFAGFMGLFFTPKKYILSIMFFFTIMIYAVFSWENWYYGGGFGARPMIETLPILAFPLAFMTNTILSKKQLVVKGLYMATLIFFVFLNIFQSYQFSLATIHYDRMSRAYYWRIFLKLHASEEDYQYLMDEKEYWDEAKKWHEN